MNKFALAAVLVRSSFVTSLACLKSTVSSALTFPVLVFIVQIPTVNCFFAYSYYPMQRVNMDIS